MTVQAPSCSELHAVVMVTQDFDSDNRGSNPVSVLTSSDSTVGTTWPSLDL